MRNSTAHHFSKMAAIAIELSEKAFFEVFKSFWRQNDLEVRCKVNVLNGDKSGGSDNASLSCWMCAEDVRVVRNDTSTFSYGI